MESPGSRRFVSSCLEVCANHMPAHALHLPKRSVGAILHPFRSSTWTVGIVGAYIDLTRWLGAGMPQTYYFHYCSWYYCYLYYCYCYYSYGWLSKL